MGATAAELEERKSKAIALLVEWARLQRELESLVVDNSTPPNTTQRSPSDLDLLEEWLDPFTTQKKKKKEATNFARKSKILLDNLHAFSVHGTDSKNNRTIKRCDFTGNSSSDDDDDDGEEEEQEEELNSLRTTRDSVDIVNGVLDLLETAMDTCNNTSPNKDLERKHFPKLQLAAVYALRSLENTKGIRKQFRKENGFVTLNHCIQLLLAIEKSLSKELKNSGDQIRTSGDNSNSDSPETEVHETLQACVRLIGDLITKNEISDNVANSESFLECGGIPLIEKILELTASGEVQYLAIGVLRVIAHYFYGHQEHASTGMNFSRVVESESRSLFSQLVVSLSSSDRDLVKQASGTIKNLCLCDKQNLNPKGGLLIPRLCEAGLIPVFFSQLTLCKPWHRVIWFLVEALDALTQANPHTATEILTNTNHANNSIHTESSGKRVEELIDLMKSPSYCHAGFSEISHKTFDIISSVLLNAKETIPPGVFSALLDFVLSSPSLHYCEHMKLKAAKLIKVSMKLSDANRRSASRAMGGLSKITKQWLLTGTNTELNKEIQGLIWSQAKWKYIKKSKRSSLPPPSQSFPPETDKTLPYTKLYPGGVVPVNISLDQG